MSASHTWFGFVAVKSRFKTLSATGNSWFESVVPTRNLRWEIARIPSDFITLATVLTRNSSPRPRSPAWTLGDPYRPRRAAWTARTLTPRSR